MSATSEGVGTALTRQGLALQVLSLRGKKKIFDNQIKYDGLGGRDNAPGNKPALWNKHSIYYTHLYISFFFLYHL